MGGLGLIRSPQGVIFCRGAIPGEVIEIDKMTKRRGVLWAEKFRVIEASPDRVAPVCRYAEHCGGCDFMHMTYEAEKRHKREMIRNALRRGLGEELPLADGIAATDSPLEYRNSIRLHGDGRHLGYHKKNSNDIVDIDDCPIAVPSIRAAIKRQDKHDVTLRAESAMSLLGRNFRVSPQSFFQCNIAMAEKIISDLRQCLPAGPRLLDLFAGVGSFALSLSDRYESVIGYEIVRSAVDDFRENANGLSHVAAWEWDASKGLKDPIAPGDVLILDPPRTGLPEKLRTALIGAEPQALAYISCDAATFARDVKEMRKGGYILSHPIYLYDMFPRTAHVELMGVFHK